MLPVRTIILLSLLFLPYSVFSQDKKIILAPDTSESLPVTFSRGIYTVYMGYNAFFKNVNLDKNQTLVLKQYIDSIIENTGMVDLTQSVKLTRHFKDGSFVTLYTNILGERTVNTMMAKGIVKVFNTVSKQYVKQLVNKTGKAKIMEDGREVKATALKYYDSGNNTEIFEYVF